MSMAKAKHHMKKSEMHAEKARKHAEMGHKEMMKEKQGKAMRGRPKKKMK